jgi:hypothetical protein
VAAVFHHSCLCHHCWQLYEQVAPGNVNTQIQLILNKSFIILKGKAEKKIKLFFGHAGHI